MPPLVDLIFLFCETRSESGSQFCLSINLCSLCEGERALENRPFLIHVSKFESWKLSKPPAGSGGCCPWNDLCQGLVALVVCFETGLTQPRLVITKLSPKPLKWGLEVEVFLLLLFLSLLRPLPLPSFLSSFLFLFLLFYFQVRVNYIAQLACLSF